MAQRPAHENELGHQAGSLENALRTFHLLRDRGSVRVAELAEELGVARSTAHRLLALLGSYGAIEQVPGQPIYRPGPLLGQLGLATLRQNELVSSIHPYLERLSEEVDETAHLIVLHGQNSVFVDSVECRRQTLRITARVGAAYPAYLTSGGKVLLAALTDSEVTGLFADSDFATGTDRAISSLPQLLAELDEARANGYATNWGESEIGVAAVAVLQRTSTGAVAGALAVSAPEQRLSPPRLSALVRSLRDVSDQVTPLLS
jgi:DNA-binding IclR family transcriptional regulator